MAAKAKYMIEDGRITALVHRQGPYLYQHLHTLDYRVRNAAAHTGVMARKAQALFGVRFTLSAERLEREVEQLLAEARLTRRVSTCVTLRCYPTGEYTLHYDEPSIYSGYVMRSLRPEAVTIPLKMPLPHYPTDASLATRQLAEMIARTRGYHTALLVDGDQIIDEECCPIAIVQGTTLLMPMHDSVEAAMLERAARKAAISLERGPINIEMLAAADEVMTINWQGITAMHHVDGRICLSLTAERLARHLEEFL